MSIKLNLNDSLKKQEQKRNSTRQNLEQNHFEQKKKKTEQNKVKESTPKKSAPSVSAPKKKVEPPKPKKKDSFMDNVKGFIKGEKVLEGFSVRDAKKSDFDTTANKIGKVSKGEKPKEVDRFIANAANSAFLGLPKELAKNSKDELTLNSYYNQRKVGEGGGKDMIAQGVGYLAPGALAVKGAKAVGLGVKEGTKGVSKALQIAKEGAVVGGAMGAAEVGIRESLNGKDTDWKDNLKHIGFGTATGAVADPLIHGVGKGISKGFESASNATMKKLLPNEQQVIDAVASNKGDKANFKLKRPEVRQPEVKQPEIKTKPKNTPKLTQEEVDALFGESPLDDSAVDEFLKGIEETRPKEPVTKTIESQSEIDVNTPMQPNRSVEPPLTKLPQKTGEQIQTPTLRTIKIDKNIEDATPDEVRSIYQHLVDKKERLLVADKGADEGVYYRQLEAVNDDIQTVRNIISNKKVEPISKEVESLFESEPVAPKVQEPTQSPLARPQHIENVDGERQHYSTVTNSEKSTDEFIEAVKRLDKKYTKITDKEAVDFANGLIKRDLEEAYQFVKNAERLDKRHTTVALRLIDEFQKNGQVDRAVDILELTAREGTAAAQKLQSFTLYNRLSVEGHLIRAQRMINKRNDLLGVNEKKQVLDEKTIAAITDSVQTMERMTGFKDAGNNIQDIMDGWKKGKNPTDDELDIVRSFMEDYKKYVGDLTPSKERVKIKTTDKRTRDKVVEFLTKEEQLAKQEIKRIMGRANSLPVDFMFHAAKYGAVKIAKGVINLADFTEEMVKDLGEEVRPYMKQIWDRSAELFNLQSEKITTKRLSEIEKITNKALKDKTITADEMDKIKEFAKKISTMSGDTHLEAQMELQMTLNALEKPTFAQQIATTHSISLLLNPLTMVRNVIGNEVGYRVDRMARMLTIPADAVRSKIFGTERTVVFVKPVDWKMFFGVKGYGKGFNMGVKGGLKGVNPFGLKTAYDIGSPAFSASKQMKENMNFLERALVSKFNPLHHLEKALNVSMRSFDTAGFNRAYTSELYHQATLKAVNEGLKGKALNEAVEKYFREADENMIALAEEYGKYSTFQNDTKLGNLLTKTKQGLNYGSTYVATAGLKPTKEFGLGNAIIPFAKTPANIVMRALEYSPAGLLQSASLAKAVYKYRNAKDILDLQIAISRAITGSVGFSLFGYILAENGVLTTAGSTDYEVAALERSAGKQANSVNISAIQRFISSGFDKKALGIKENDTFVSYDWMQPVSLSLALGTGVNQSMKEEGVLNPLQASMTAANSGAKTMLNMSVLSGLNDFISTYNGKEFSDYFVNPIKNLPSAFVPTASNQVRKLTDNQARNTYSPDFGEAIWNKMKNRTPELEKSLPISYDTFGKPRESYQGGTNNAFNVLFNPSFVSDYKPSPEAKFVLDFINQTGEKSVAPPLAPREVDGVKLTGAQQSEMQRIMGEEVQRKLERLVPMMEGSTNTEKIRKTLKDVMDDAREKARKEMRRELGL